MTVSYCHCLDCRRHTGAPVAAFAAFPVDAVRIDPPLGAGLSIVDGAERWSCKICGSPIAGRYDYLPDQIYIALGLLDQADALPPEMHSHADNCLTWLHIADDLPRSVASARDALRSARPADE